MNASKFSSSSEFILFSLYGRTPAPKRALSFNERREMNFNRQHVSGAFRAAFVGCVVLSLAALALPHADVKEIGFYFVAIYTGLSMLLLGLMRGHMKDICEGEPNYWLHPENREVQWVEKKFFMSVVVGLALATVLLYARGDQAVSVEDVDSIVPLLNYGFMGVFFYCHYLRWCMLANRARGMAAFWADEKKQQDRTDADVSSPPHQMPTVETKQTATSPKRMIVQPFNTKPNATSPSNIAPRSAEKSQADCSKGTSHRNTPAFSPTKATAASPKKIVTQPFNPATKAIRSQSTSPEAKEEKKAGGGWALVFTLVFLLWSPWGLYDDAMDNFLSKRFIVNEAWKLEPTHSC